MNRCPKCDAAIDDSMAYCESCGERVTLQQSTTEEQIESKFELDAVLEKISQQETVEIPIHTDDTQELEASPTTAVAQQKNSKKHIKNTRTVNVATMMSYSIIIVLLSAVIGVFTLLWSVLPSPQKWLDDTNTAFEQKNMPAFYDAFVKPAPMIATEETFYHELATNWPTLSAQLQEAIDKKQSFAVLSDSTGRDILEFNLIKTFGLTDASVRYLPTEVTIIAPLQYETISIGNTELFSIYAQEIFNVYAVPGTYTMHLTHKGQTQQQTVILQTNGEYTMHFNKQAHVDSR